MITNDQLRRFAPKADSALVDSINAVITRFNINTPRRVRYFMTQAGFETQMFTKFEEDLLYRTPERLVAVWPSRFTMDRTDTRKGYAPEYVNNAQKLANFAYGGRNGNKGPNDGWLYRGRGGFHLTFLDNYAAYSKAIYGDDRCITNPGLVALPADAMMSAAWFWDTHRFNQIADADQFTRMTSIINGSDVTVPERLAVLRTANQIF